MKTLAAVLNREFVINKNAERALIVMLFSFLTFAGAMIRIPLPFTPVPLTMQTFVLFMAVYYLNPRELGLSQLIYILAGVVGVPVFAAGVSGMLALAGPTAGYLLGFIVAGTVMAVLKSKIKISFINMSLIFTFGAVIYLTLGTSHLWLVYHMPFDRAFVMGFLPFIIGDALKILAASALLRR